LDLITVLYLTRFSLKPMRLFGGLGALAVIGGITVGLIAVILKLAAGFHLTRNPLLYGSFFGIMIGLQFILMGMTAEMNTRTHYESQERRPYAISRVRSSRNAYSVIDTNSNAITSKPSDRAA